MNEAALPQSTVHIAQADPDGILLVIHAGAGNRGKKDTPERRAQVEQDLNRALEAGYALLEQGGSGGGCRVRGYPCHGGCSGVQRWSWRCIDE